ncbi:MAG: translesion DNA synthesis-associated protein ImuA [Rhodoferax sp.]
MNLSALIDAPWPAQVWRADTLAPTRPDAGVLPSGHAVLDAQLPGGGWPRGALCEILQPPGTHAHWQLLLPALRSQARAPSCAQSHADLPRVALVAPPHTPYGPALAAQGLHPGRLLWLRAQTTAQRLWAAEQLLLADLPLVVLLWLGADQALGTAPEASVQSAAVDASALRRLHRAAGVRGQMLFVLRPLAAAQQPSPAVVRVAAQWPVPVLGAATRSLQLRVLKRRGPPLARALELSLGPHVVDRRPA